MNNRHTYICLNEYQRSVLSDKHLVITHAYKVLNTLCRQNGQSERFSTACWISQSCWWVEGRVDSPARFPPYEYRSTSHFRFRQRLCPRRWPEARAGSSSSYCLVWRQIGTAGTCLSLCVMYSANLQRVLNLAPNRATFCTVAKETCSPISCLMLNVTLL